MQISDWERSTQSRNRKRRKVGEPLDLFQVPEIIVVSGALDLRFELLDVGAESLSVDVSQFRDK